MKVCLVSPPTVSEFNERLVIESEALRLIAEHAPMGILSLAAVLDLQGVETEIIDLNRLYYQYVDGKYRRQGIEFCSYAVDYFQKLTAEVFGFSTICSCYPLTLRLARRVRQIHPESRIVLGGPQASVVDVATLREFPFIDVIVRGEAEETLLRLLHAFSERRPDLSGIAGLTFRNDDKVFRNSNAPVIENLDLLPMAAFHLYPYIRECSYAPLEAGRGCPFACSFCSTNDFFRRRFRMKSPQVLVEQMKSIKDTYGLSSFDLVHDMFTVDRKKVVRFCDAVEQSGEQLYWSCSARTDCIDDELIDRMAAAGCYAIFFGVDTGSARMQEIIHKRLDLNAAAARIKRTNAHKIKHTVSLITGFPEETKADLRETISFVGDTLRHEHAEIQLHLLAPLAETPITSAYRDVLVYDDIFSDISFQGWEQDPEDREMIMAHRDIFPNFYGVPTRWLDRQYLRQLREFILHAIHKAKWLLLLLHRDSGDLVRVFDEWTAWSARARNYGSSVDTSRSYYASEIFPKDLTRFVDSHYLEAARYPHLVRTMVAIEIAQLSLAENQNCKSESQRLHSGMIESLEWVPALSSDTRLLLVSADYKRLMRSLKRKERFDAIPSAEVALALLKKKDEIKVVQLNTSSYELMRLCDGSRNIKQIAGEFSVADRLGISPLKASVYGLASLAERGFIEITPLSN